jgi:putative phosphoribosyl transferase
MVAAVRWARARGARTVIVAVPVGAAPTVRTLEQEADEVVCLAAPPFFGAVGSWYDDFHQVPDEDVLALLGASQRHDVERMEVDIPIEGARHTAELSVPGSALGWVLFAHGSGSSRRSPRNVQVASALNDAGIATVLFDLLTPAEEHDRRNVFDVDLLARRVIDATGWLQGRPETQGLPVGYFGASTGAAAALVAAAELGDAVAAVVSRGGRPDLAGARLAEVRAPTLLVVGGADEVVLDLNRAAAGQLACPHELVVVPRATHLFPEPGALETVCSLASAWFVEHLGAWAAVPTPSGAR